MFRCLTGVPYYGLSLTRDGLHMHVGDDPADVLAANPTQTWSFYIECPVIRDHQSILDPNWRFTTAPAMRTIISCIDEHNFILLTVTRDGSRALTMRQCVDYLQSAFDPLWTYNLDGGPSIALYYRLSPEEDWVRVAGGTSRMRTLWHSRTKIYAHKEDFRWQTCFYSTVLPTRTAQLTLP